MERSVSIVVPHLENRTGLLELLGDLQGELRTPEDEVLIIDNSAKLFHDPIPKDDFPDLFIDTLHPGHNVGVASGWNVGAAQARHEFVLFINDDIRLFEGKNIARMLDVFEDAPNAKVVGVQGKLMHWIPEKRIMGNKAPFDWDTKNDRGRNGSLPSRCHRVTGFMWMIRKSWMLEIGGFDEQFSPAFYEEDDFCLRTLQNGGEIWTSCVRYYHKIIASNGINTNEQIPYLGTTVGLRDVFQRNGDRFWRKWKDFQMPEVPPGCLVHHPRT